MHLHSDRGTLCGGFPQWRHQHVRPVIRVLVITARSVKATYIHTYTDKPHMQNVPTTIYIYVYIWFCCNSVHSPYIVSRDVCVCVHSVCNAHTCTYVYTWTVCNARVVPFINFDWMLCVPRFGYWSFLVELIYLMLSVVLFNYIFG